MARVAEERTAPVRRSISATVSMFMSMTTVSVPRSRSTRSTAWPTGPVADDHRERFGRGRNRGRGRGVHRITLPQRAAVQQRATTMAGGAAPRRAFQRAGTGTG